MHSWKINTLKEAEFKAFQVIAHGFRGSCNWETSKNYELGWSSRGFIAELRVDRDTVLSAI